MGAVSRADGAGRLLAPAQAQGRKRAGAGTVVAVVLAAGALLAACGSSSKPAEGTGSTTPGGADTTKVSVVLSDDGCAPDPATVDAGVTEFDVENHGSAKVTEAELKNEDETHILGEKENITPGLSTEFTLTLVAGKYKMVCPGGKQDSWDFTVKGAAVTSTTTP